MTLREKQEKIVDYILECDNLYEEVLWLVQKVTPTDIKVLEYFDGIFMDEDDNLVFDEKTDDNEDFPFKPKPIPGT